MVGNPTFDDFGNWIETNISGTAEESCPSCAALRAEMERKWGQYKQIIDDVFDGCECSPKCDSHAHEEDCAAVNGPVAVRKLRSRVAVLEKVVEAVKHGHATRHDTTAAMEKCPLCAALDAAKEG